MCSKFIKLIVLLSLLVCCGFAGRVLYSRSVVQGKDPRHILVSGVGLFSLGLFPRALLRRKDATH